MRDNILVFGGGDLQLSIIDRAKKMGYKTIVIDPDSEAKAKEIADVFIKVEGNDFETTKQIALNYDVKGIVTSATDKPILMMCRIAEELKLTFPTYSSCETLLDKGKFKSFLEKHKVQHASGGVFSKNEIIPESQFDYPVIIKPLKNSGSRGVMKCDNYSQLLRNINEIDEFCDDGQFIIEQFVVGEEISVEAIVYENKVHIIQITDKVVTEPPYNVEIGHSQPSKYIFREGEIRILLQKVIDETGLNNCAIHPELKIKDESITIIEIGPRLGGDFITSHLVPLSTDVNMEDIVILMAMGKKVEFSMANKCALISYLNLPLDTEIKSIPSEVGIKRRFPQIKEIKITLAVGMKIKLISNSLNRYGHFIIQDTNRVALNKLEKEVNQYIFMKLIGN